MSPPNIPVAAPARIEAVKSATLLATRADARGLLPQLVPGQVLSARVDTVLPDGSFRVMVASQPLAMALPKYFAPGDSFELAFVAREPRLTFALSAAPPAGLAPEVSAAGRVIASALPRPGEAAMAVTAGNAEPLLAAATEDGALLSTKLEGTLTQSGLFYESHQAEWVAGRRELAALLREPQAHFAPTVQQPATQSAQAPALSVMQDAASAFAATNELTLSAATARGEPALPQPVQALLQQQLAALETGKLAFHLEIWPGQWMQWEIDDDAQHAGSRTSDATPRFQTRLHLDLAKLGALDVTLSFDAAGVRVRLDAGKQSSVSVLQDHRLSLRAALAGAGMAVADIAVARHG